MPTPKPKKRTVKQKFTFAEAILHINEGRKVTKMEWKNPNEYILLHDGFLCIHHSADDDDLFYRLMVSENDLKGEDFQVIVEEDYEKN